MNIRGPVILRTLEKLQTKNMRTFIQEMSSRNIRVDMDDLLSYVTERGGYIGMDAGTLITQYIVPVLGLDSDLDCDEINEIIDQLPPRVGAYCNDLGHGIRGSITGSEYDRLKNKRAVKLIGKFVTYCMKLYKAAEDDLGINDPTIVDGEPDWSVMGTERAREIGVIEVI